MSVRVRFAPSPTGFVHVGGLRTALYNYLFARAHDGTYLLRIEDTDQERYVEGTIESMLESLEWAGIHHQEGVMLDGAGQLTEKGSRGPYIQSQRLPIYRAYLSELLEKEQAYRCFCSKERLEKVREQERLKKGTPKYDGHCRSLSEEEIRQRMDQGDPYVVRLKLPTESTISFDDRLRGHVSVNTEDLDDQVLMKSDGFPTYHFAVVVDDHLMEITHIIRGEEWLASTPKHVYLYQAMGWKLPEYVHLPNILNIDRKKLSKRHGDVAAEDFRRRGYLPEALVNFLALVGWSPGESRELFTLEELETHFSLDRVSRSGGVFDLKKLNWMNAHYIREASLDRLTRLAVPYLVEAGFLSEQEAEEKWDWVKDLVAVLRENLDCLEELPEKAQIFFRETVTPEDQESVEWMNSDEMNILRPPLMEALKALDSMEESQVKGMFKQLQKSTGLKGPKFFKPVRVALTGRSHGPDMVLVMRVLGRETILKRLQDQANHT